MADTPYIDPHMVQAIIGLWVTSTWNRVVLQALIFGVHHKRQPDVNELRAIVREAVDFMERGFINKDSPYRAAFLACFTDENIEERIGGMKGKYWN